MLTRLLALSLLAGVLCFAAGAAVHPMLTGDAARDLAIMAATPRWRTVHLVMLAGSGLVVAGVWVRLVDRPREGAAAAAPAAVALAIVSLGVAINALDIAYMAGAGTHLADMFRAGQGDAAVTLFATTHPIGRMMARFGNLLVALGAAALGAVEWSDRTRPRWLAGVAFFHESSPVVLAAVAALCAWEVATAWRALKGA